MCSLTSSVSLDRGALYGVASTTQKGIVTVEIVLHYTSEDEPFKLTKNRRSTSFRWFELKKKFEVSKWIYRQVHSVASNRALRAQ